MIVQLNFATNRHVRQAIQSASREVILTLPDITTVRDPGAPDIVAAQQATRAGIKVHAYVWDAAAQPEALSNLVRAGVSVHRVSRPMPKMWIIDRSVVAFTAGASTQQPDALIGRDLPFTELLLEGLDSGGGGRREESSPQPEPLAREVLQQLARGAKDESAAREMGIALRTYRRMVARLMEQLNARSRFQAGYRAAVKEWL